LPSLRGQHGCVTVDGVRLETLHFPCADEAAPTIVMLHEGLGSVSLWKDFPELVAAATCCEVLVYSRRGHGKSDRLDGTRTVRFMHEEATVVLPALLEQLDIQKPVLLGHSDGGSIALIYAAAHTAKLLGLALEAPHVFVEDLTLQSIARIGTSYKTTDLRQKLARHHDDVDGAFWAWNRIWLDPAFRNWNIEDRLSKIACPLLVIQGTEDEYGTLAQVQAIQSGVPQAQTLVLQRCGHAPHHDQPDVTLKAISQFVSGLA
jgi:pimeloyl-ACP methyl ester carboxylesterase